MQETPFRHDFHVSTGDFKRDCASDVGAFDENGNRVLLKDLNPDSVRFVGGLWRIQRETGQYNILNVRDKQFILLEKLDIHEKNLFEYYKASVVYRDCYGVLPPRPNYIVAKYDTCDGPMWGYGGTIQAAPAFLGIALFDKYNDVIHQAAGRSPKKPTNSKETVNKIVERLKSPIYAVLFKSNKDNSR